VMSGFQHNVRLDRRLLAPASLTDLGRYYRREA
jgi:hypothetical protein